MLRFSGSVVKSKSPFKDIWSLSLRISGSIFKDSTLGCTILKCYALWMADVPPRAPGPIVLISSHCSHRSFRQQCLLRNDHRGPRLNKYDQFRVGNFPLGNYRSATTCNSIVTHITLQRDAIYNRYNVALWIISEGCYFVDPKRMNMSVITAVCTVFTARAFRLLWPWPVSSR